MRHKIGTLLLAVSPGLAASVERSLPSFFIPNQGQVDPAFRYFIETPDLRAGFAENSAVFQLGPLTLQVRFAGADPATRIIGQKALPAHANFMTGNQPEKWRTGVPVYEKIYYRNLYPGIDLSYGGAGRRIKSEFTVAPGADPARIRLVYSGGDLSLDSNGDLVVRGPRIEVREQAPIIYQGHATVPGRYRLLDARTVTFEIGAYDSSAPLIIDPVLSYATYFGGSRMSSINGVAVDSYGNLYVTGWTESLDFQIDYAYQAANHGGVDAFIAKFNDTGSALVYATYIGGSGDDRGMGLAVDSAGQVYVTGSTASANFPLVVPVRSTLGGGRDAFALKLNAIGNALVYSTYLGGTNTDMGTAIAVDASGNAYIAGDTWSANFPVAGAAQAVFGGQTDAFVTKLTPGGAISFSTFLGGSGVEHAGGIAVDSSGNAYVAGGTTSANFPLASPIQASLGGYQNAFLTKIQAGGAQWIYSTYLGGNGATAGAPEQANAVALDSSGNAYLAGVTNSANFPVTAGAFQTVFLGLQDAFVAKVNAAGSALVYSTFLGGTTFDQANALAIDPNGNAYVAGYTSSVDFPTVSSLQAFNGPYDAFVSVLNAAGNALSFSTFYGGTGSDESNAVAVDSSGNIYTGGQTSSLDLSLRGPIQSSNVGGSVGWVARLGVTTPAPETPAAVSVSPSSGSGTAATFTAQFSDNAGAMMLTSTSILVNSTASSNSACQVNYVPGSNLLTLTNDVSSTGSVAVTLGSGSAQNSQCTLNGAGSSVSLGGTSVTLTVSVTFKSLFAGNRNVFLYAAAGPANTGWIARGTWTIPAPQPSAVSVSPSNGGGSSQTFTFVFSDTQNALNLTGMAMLFNTSVSSVNACSMSYDRNAGTLALAWDNASGSNTKLINSTSTISNSQCIVGASSVTVSGLSNTISVAITFKSSFPGTKNIYMYGSESGIYTTGWVLKGTYAVAPGGAPVANSVSPSSGAGASQRFTATVSDAGGSGFLTGLALLIAASQNTNSACYMIYDRTANVVSLAYDNSMNGASPVVPGSSTVVSNSQCTLRGANTSVTIGTTTMAVTVDIAFAASYAGGKNLYLMAVERGVNSGWVNLGTWTVSSGAPAPVSVSPSSGSGSSPSFTFTVSDPASVSNLTGMSMLITPGTSSGIANACYLVYNRVNATIGLYGNDGVSFSSKGVGSSTTMQNSQCAVGYTVGWTSGNSLLFSVNVVFKSAFNGAKNVYLQANEAAVNSTWVQEGTWTVQ